MANLKSRVSALAVLAAVVGITAASPSLIRANDPAPRVSVEATSASAPSIEVPGGVTNASGLNIDASGKSGLGYGLSWSSTTKIAVKLVHVPYMKGGFQSGVAVVLYATDYIDLPDLEWKLNALFDRLVDAHVSVVSLNYPIYTDGLRSTRLYKGELTPSDDAIRFFLKKASARGFATVLRPILDEKVIIATGKKGEWRGTIRHTNVNAWFQNYATLLLGYAKLGEEEHADIVDVGTELVSMEHYQKQWRGLISEIRKTFHGELTYSSNRGISDEMPWDSLDFISVDAFFELQTPEGATEDDMVRAWQKWVRDLTAHAAKTGKRLVLTELGSTPQKGAHRKSWMWNHNSALDLADQQHFYAASCAAWKPKLHGIYWWAANVWLPENPTQDSGFTPMGKPAEAEINVCFS